MPQIIHLFEHKYNLPRAGVDNFLVGNMLEKRVIMIGMKKMALKHDKYRKARGGYSRLLEVHCEHCDHVIALYQKDGPGPLKRMYIDRIVSPEQFSKFQHLPIKKVPNLICPHCKRLIGIPYVYEKEKRPAFRLFQGSVTKKIAKAR